MCGCVGPYVLLGLKPQIRPRLPLLDIQLIPTLLYRPQSMNAHASLPTTVRLPGGRIAHISPSNEPNNRGPPYPSEDEIRRNGVSRYTLVNLDGTISSTQLTQERYERRCIQSHGSVAAAEADRARIRGGRPAAGVSDLLLRQPFLLAYTDYYHP